MYLSNVMQDVFSIPLSRDPWISCFVSRCNTQVQILLWGQGRVGTVQDVFWSSDSVFHHNIESSSVIQAPVVQTLDSAIHRINLHPATGVIDFRNTFLPDSDPPFEQPGPGLIMMPFFQEESDTRLAVQEALSMMAPSYKNADSTILALIEALILNYVQQVPAFYNTNNNLWFLEPMIWLAIIMF